MKCKYCGGTMIEVIELETRKGLNILCTCKKCNALCQKLYTEDLFGINKLVRVDYGEAEEGIIK